jgi:hypothetical protein
MDQESFIWIVTNDHAEYSSDGSKGRWGEDQNQGHSDFKGVKISALELEKRMADFIGIVGRLFQHAELQAHQQEANRTSLLLEQVELSVEISVEGEVKLVAGVKAASKGGIILRFKRKELERKNGQE